MASKSHLRHQMADHKNWSPAIHFQELGEIENVKHTFELKLSPDITEAQKDELLGHLEQIAEERDLGYEYHAFFHYHGQGRNKETYFVVTTKGAVPDNVEICYEIQDEKEQIKSSSSA